MVKKTTPDNYLNILVLSHISELLGGAERSMLDVLDVWQRDYGVKPEFVLRLPVKSLGNALDERGWPYYGVDYRFWSDANLPRNPEDIFHNALRNSKAIQEIEEIIRDSQPDLVVTNSLVCPWAAIAAHYQRVPHVWFVREFGDLDHGREFEIGRDKTLTDVGNLSELVVANSETLESHLAQYIPERKLTTLYTPFDLEAVTRRKSEHVDSPFKSENSLKLITTNNIAPTKGQTEAAEAVGILNQEGDDVELCIMGTGEKEHIQAIKNIAHGYGIMDKVHLIGSKPDTIPYIALADVGIMASRREAFGRATFECLAASTPVIGADSGATPEIVASGKNGYLYEQGSPESMAEKITEYLRDRSLLEQHGVAGRRTAEAMMGGEHTADALYERIRHLVGTEPEPPAQPIHYLHQWSSYLEAAHRTMRKAHTFSLLRVLLVRAKAVIRPRYYRLRSLLTRLRGR
jgi:glycosyltransferase involved in cell wall biosynthesis